MGISGVASRSDVPIFDPTKREEKEENAENETDREDIAYSLPTNIPSNSVLLPDGTWQDSQGPNKIFIIDWENIQFGHRAVDVGGILADFYERYHFKDITASLSVMEGFIQGYGKLSEELAFAAAIHAGVHLICWYYRRDRDAPLPYPLPRVLAALTIGRDLILKGWAKDKSGLQKSILASLFKDENLT